MKGTGLPRELLGLASGLLRRGDPETAGLWPRVSAILALQALEASLLELWRRRALALHGCPIEAQLICLPSYLGDATLAARVRHAWSALDHACHHRSYDLAPTAGELRAWFTAVDELIGRVTAP